MVFLLRVSQKYNAFTAKIRFRSFFSNLYFGLSSSEILTFSTYRPIGISYLKSLYIEDLIKLLLFVVCKANEIVFNELI